MFNVRFVTLSHTQYTQSHASVSLTDIRPFLSMYFNSVQLFLRKKKGGGGREGNNKQPWPQKQCRGKEDRDREAMIKGTKS